MARSIAKRCCSCSFECTFWCSLAVICLYLFYCGSVLPMEIGKHLLMHHKLVDIAVMNTELDWSAFNVRREGLSMISYQELVPMKYRYFIGSQSIIIHEHNTSTLYNATWSELSDFIENKQSDSNQYELQMVMVSKQRCVDIVECLHDHFPSVEGIQYIFSEIKAVRFMPIDSKIMSMALDNTRDVLAFIIMAMLSLFYMFAIDGLSRWRRHFPPLSLCFLWTSCHFLWTLTLSLLPIFRAFDRHRDAGGYYAKLQLAATYHVGTEWEGGIWWVFGVIHQGVWNLFIFSFFPFCATINKLCPKRHRRSFLKIAKFGYIMTMNLFSIILFAVCIGFVVNVDTATYKPNLSSPYWIQCVAAICSVIVILPLCSCFILRIDDRMKTTAQKDAERKEYDRNYCQRAVDCLWKTVLRRRHPAAAQYTHVEDDEFGHENSSGLSKEQLFLEMESNRNPIDQL